MQRFLGGFDIVYRGQHKVTMDPQKLPIPPQNVINSPNKLSPTLNFQQHYFGLNYANVKILKESTDNVK